MAFLSGRIDFVNVDTWNKYKKNWNKTSYSNFPHSVYKKIKGILYKQLYICLQRTPFLGNIILVQVII